MRILLVCVNYNSYHHLLTYARSLALAHDRSEGVDFRLVVVDNSTITTDHAVLAEIRSIIDDFVYFKSSNIGYFPAVAFALDALANQVDPFDYIAVSNVDLEVASDFFIVLSEYVVKDNDGVLAPSLLSHHRRADLNPKILNRPTIQKLRRNIAIFSSPLLFWFYGKFSDIKFCFSRPPASCARNIYAPHGSFMIFTKQFFDSGCNLRYPQFLFGEEIFVGEECASHNLYVRYLPELIVHDMDHGSTSLQSVRFISSEHMKSLHYLLEKYFT